MRRIIRFAMAAGLVALSGQAQIKQPRPGWNLFSVQQDEQLGREAAQEVYKQMPLVHNQELDGYLATILRKLSETPHGKYYGGTNQPIPYTIRAVYDKNINAFSLPGGPMFVNTGLLQAADNEAQLAGVIAHEMSHVVLRHATNQASKRNLIALPAMLAGALAGNSMLGQLTQLGIGLGANSVLLKFSRSAESEADYNGAAMMADAGYNPLELAHFFEKLEAQGSASRVAQFLSDHPNPGNRVKAIDDEIRQLPRRNYVVDQTGQFPRIKDLVLHLPGPGRLRGDYGNDGHAAPTAPTARPSSRMREYRSRSFSFNYPENWQVFGDGQGNMVTIAPTDGVVRGQNGQVSVGYGFEMSYYFPEGTRIVLDRDTQALIRQLQAGNSGMRVARESRNITVGGERGLETTIYSRSPYQGEQEVDELVTISRPEGLFYMGFIAPQSEYGQVQSTFQDILRSLRFS